jgi:hypothetical protein
MRTRILAVIISVLMLVFAFMGGGFQPTRVKAETTTPSNPEISLISTDSDGVTLEIQIPEYDREIIQLPNGNFERLSYPGANFTTAAGQPQLPILTTLIGIPPEAEILIQILDQDSVTLPGEYSIIPVPTLSYEDLFQPGERSYQWDADSYATEEFLPTQNVTLGSPAWVRDQRLVSLNFYPFQYNPSTGEVFWHQRIRLRVNFQTPKSTHPETQNIPTAGRNPFDSMLAGSLLNYAQATNWRQTPTASQSQTAMNGITTSAGQNRYKITVLEDGLYKIPYADLVPHMANIDSVDPQKFQITSQGVVVDIYVTGEVDHSFDSGDAIYFYGQKFYGDRLAEFYAAEDDLWRSIFYVYNGPAVVLNAQNSAAMFEKYTDENVYWLIVDENNGSRMDTLNVNPTGNLNPAESHFRETIRAEESESWYTFHFTSVDTWFWQDISSGVTSVTNTFTTTLPSVVTTPISATVRGDVVSKNFSANPNNQHTKIQVNSIEVVDEYWGTNKPARYTFEADFDQANLVSGENYLGFSSLYEAGTTTTIRHFFDWFEIEYQRGFEAENDQLEFTQTAVGDYKYTINNFNNTSGALVLDITNPLTPTRLTNPAITADAVTISTTNIATSTYFVASEAAAQAPTISYYAPPDLLNTSNAADYVFITHADFVTATQTLANYRASQGLSTQVIDMDDLYNEFNYGIFHPLAIKMFLKYAVENWATGPVYALLIGDGHWNLKNFNTARYGSTPLYLPPYLAWVDPWQGEIESTNLLANIVGTDPLPDIHIGRLPVNTAAELNAAITKIINYEAADPAPWQFRMLFVADNPDSAGNFTNISNDIITEYLDSEPLYQADRIYQENFGCTSKSSAQCQAVTQAITTTLNTTGTLILSYHGHGSARLWSDESILETNDLTSLTNSDKLPIILSLDCWDGAWYFPEVTYNTSSYPGLIEELVRSNNSGAVAAFAPSGLGVATGHDELHRGFLEALFVNDEWELGPASYNAKIKYYQNYSSDPYLLHTFTVIGDPALRIHKPQEVFIPLVIR